MSIKVLRDQKEEYLEHLFEVLSEPVIHLFQEIYDQSLQSNPKYVLKQFQIELAKIPEWNQLQVEEAYKTIKCDYFSKLMKTVYILTIKVILLGIPEDKRNKIKVKVPPAESFVHRCLIHIARELWKRPYLFYHLSRSIERQNNLYNCEVILRKKIKAVIRETIPMDWVVGQVGAEEEESEEEEEEESEVEESEEEEEEDDESEVEEEEEESEVEESEEDSEVEEEEEEEEEEESEVEEEEDDEEEDEEEEKVVPIVEEIESVIQPPVEEISQVPVAVPEVPMVVPEVPVVVPIEEASPEEEAPVAEPSFTPLPIIEESTSEESQLQNYVIPTEAPKKVIYVEEPAVAPTIPKKKKPKNTFF